MILASFDVRRWNLPLAAVAAAGLACGPAVDPEGETDTNPSSTSYDYYDTDYYCADGTAGCCQGSDCYYEPYEPYECYEDADCDSLSLCDDQNTCQPVDELLDCEATTEVVPLELPVDPAHMVVSLAFVEVDGDPGQELVVGRLGSTELYLGPEPTPIMVPGAELATVTASVAGDFDGDEVPDLALSTLDLGLMVLVGDGAGGFTPLMNQADITWAEQLAALQWDAGGVLDLAVLRTGELQMLVGDGLGSLALLHTFPQLEVTSAMAAGRFGGDGSGDLVVQHGQSSTTVYLGSPAGDVEGDTSLAGELYGDRRLLAGAIGGGADDEIVAHSSAGSAGDWSLLELWVDATDAPQLYALSGGIDHAAMGDVDGDGAADLVLGGVSALSYVRSTASPAALSCRASLFFSGAGTDALAVGDLDGNGRADVAYASQDAVTVLLTQ